MVLVGKERLEAQPFFREEKSKPPGKKEKVEQLVEAVDKELPDKVLPHENFKQAVDEIEKSHVCVRVDQPHSKKLGRLERLHQNGPGRRSEFLKRGFFQRCLPDLRQPGGIFPDREGSAGKSL